VWRVRISRVHWHPYLIGKFDHQLIPLGGFPSPDLARVAAIVPPSDTGLFQLLERAQMLAALADEAGAYEVYFGSNGAPVAVAEVWATQRGSEWPADTVWVHPDGSA